jgi:PAS domain S-box-containing protein
MFSKQEMQQPSIDDVFRSSLDGLFLIDRDCRFVSYSDSCAHITGFPAAEMVGQQCDCEGVTNCHDSVDRSLAGTLCPGRQIFMGGLPNALQRMRIRHREGHFVWVETAYSPVRDAGGNVVLIAGIMRNITDAVERENELKEASMNRRYDQSELGQASLDGAGSSEVAGRSTPERGGGAASLDDILNGIEKREIVGALHRANGQRTLAARMLGISRSRLYRRMEALGIDPSLATSDEVT